MQTAPFERPCRIVSRNAFLIKKRMRKVMVKQVESVKVLDVKALRIITKNPQKQNALIGKNHFAETKD